MPLTRDQFEYYLNFARRVFSKCLNFSGATLDLEKESLKQEYILRGYDADLLQELIELCQELAAQVRARG